MTAADNDVGGFLYAEPDNHGIDLVQVVLTNTLLYGFDNAFIARQSDPGVVTIEHRNTLLQNVTSQHLNLDGVPTFIATNPITGEAKLDASYHLQSGSDAIDAGLETGVTDDIDGQFRPQAAAPDIGSDEYLELVAPATLDMSGPPTVVANTDSTFLAKIGPINVTRPLTYHWSATGLDDVIHTAGLSDTVSFNWPTTGSKSISLTVSNMVAGRGDTYAVTVISAPSLAIEKSGPAEALAGSQITYELTVANSGVAGASGLVITDTVPANTTSVTALDGGSVNSGLVQWNLANLAGGSEATVRFQVTAGQTITNDDYAVTAVGGYSAVGATPVTTIFGQPQLAIVKSGPVAAAPGQGIVYELTISNTGLVSATDVVVSDTLPPGASYVSGGQLIGDVVRWQIDSIAANGGLAKVSFSASANATVTNSDYEVKATGGFSALGSEDVSTIIGTGTRYVAKTGSDGLNNCANSAAPCATVQHAVNVANPGEEIRVAQGTYAGPQWITAGNGYRYKQVVFIDKSVTLRGGYSISDWSTSDPAAYGSIIYAQASGRGLTILDTANNVVTVDGFGITGGDYTGLGNADEVANAACDKTGYDCGGGVFVSNSAVVLRRLVIHDNSAGSGESAGGGIFIWPARATTIEATQVVSNSAGNGGGLYVADTILPINISDSEFRDNLADEGGGISLSGSINELVTISRVDVISNTAVADSGGGIYARLTEDGLMLNMDRVRLQNNRAYDQGKALRLDAAGPTIPRVNLSNLLLSGNGRTDGAPVTEEEAVVTVQTKFSSMEVSIKHVSAAGNTVANFLYVEPREHAGYFASVVLTNTLLSGFENAYAAKEVGLGEATIQHEKTLLHNVSNQHANLGGTPGFTAVDAISGDPKLDSTYHLTTGSAAIDVAVATDVSNDIDGDSRPLGGGPDIGADEFVPSPPGAFGKAGPGNGASNQATSPILIWQPSSGAATYELCYDSINNNTCEGGWIDAGSVLSKTVAGLSSGTTYYWQVRAVNVLGHEEADAGTWWSFTTGTPPAAFGKSGPANGAGNLTISPTIFWSDPGNATAFEVCYDTLNDNRCGGEWLDAGSILSASLSGLSYGTSYYWQVRAVNSIGQTGADGGSWWLFTTGNRPGHFDKISPADGATIEATALDLSWEESSDAVSYEYCYDTTDDESCNGGWTSAGGNTSASISGLSAGTTYYWQVKAVNTLDNREANNWTWWSFTVASAPAAFGKSSPSDGAGDQSGSPTLSWQTSAGAASYAYCYDLTDDDSCDGSWLSAGSNTSVALTGLLYEQRYYWQVRALNGLGTESADGDTWWSFEIMEAPYSVRLPLLLRP